MSEKEVEELILRFVFLEEKYGEAFVDKIFHEASKRIKKIPLSHRKILFAIARRFAEDTFGKDKLTQDFYTLLSQLDFNDRTLRLTPEMFKDIELNPKKLIAFLSDLNFFLDKLYRHKKT